MYCFKCGSEIDDSSFFCSKCGARVGSDPERTGNAKKRLLIICCVGTVVIATAVAALFYFYRVLAAQKTVWNGGVEPFDGGVTGEKSNPYVIDTAQKLAYLSQQVAGGDNFAGKYFLLSDNIDLNGTKFNWTPIGSSHNLFAGSFDGNGKTVSNLKVYQPDAENAALFGATRGSIANLSLISADVTGKNQVGGLVGLSFGGAVENCAMDGSVTGDSFVGGLVGNNIGGEISNSSSQGRVSGNNKIGGLVGSNSGVVSGCIANSSVGGNEYVGGLVGDNEGTVKNGIANGSVVGKGRYVDTLIGRKERGSTTDSAGNASVLIEMPKMTNVSMISAVLNDLRRTKSASLLYYVDHNEWPQSDWPDGRSLDRYLDFPMFGSSPEGAMYGLSAVHIALNSATGNEKTLIGFDLETGENSSFINHGVKESLAREARGAGLLNDNGGRYDGGRFIYILLK